MPPLRSHFLLFLLASGSALAQLQTTPLSGIPIAAPARVDRVLGHTAAGAARHYTIGSLIDVYNVKHYGAVGNGTTDDTTAIALAFSSAPAGSHIYFPAGTYLLTSPITISVDNLTISGTGATLISNATGQDRKFTVVGRTGIKFIGLRIDGGAFTTENMTAPPGFPPPEHPDWVFPGFDTYTPRNRPGTIHFKDSADCEVIDCRIEGVNWPVTIIGDCNRIKIDRCTFAEYYTAVYSYFSDDTSTHNEDDGGHPQPRCVSVTNNNFLPGKYRSWEFYNEYGIYGDRDYTFSDKGCSGAIKFRGENGASTKPWNVAAQHIITGNTIRDAGMMGIELQGCANDSIVSNNSISSCPFGISLSTISRMVVANNTIKDTIYASIECEGWLEGSISLPNNDGILITDNLLEGRDDYGRPANWVDNFGIVVDDFCRNVVISGGVIKYHRTGIAVKGSSYNVRISGVRITTNEQSGNGGVGPYPEGPWTDNFVQGILVLNSSKVDISDCSLSPTLTAWCRMVNLINATSVRLRNCTIESNNTGAYLHGVSDVLIQGCYFLAGGTPAGTSPAFIFVDASGGDCTDMTIRDNRFKGTIANGISVYAPTDDVSSLFIEGNDTRLATVSNARFLDIGISGTGTATGIITRGNLGGATESNSIDIPVKVVTGTDGDFADRAAFSTLSCLYTTVINLQSGAYQGQRKNIILTTAHSVTINPAATETINGSATAIVLSAQWDRVTLESNGAGDWAVISGSPTASLPIGNAVVKNSFKVDAGNSGLALRQIAGVTITHDFGTIAAGAEATHGFTIPCGTGITNRPVLSIGWIEYFDPAINVRSYIDSNDHGTVRLYNPTAAPSAVGSLTFRAICIEPNAP